MESKDITIRAAEEDFVRELAFWLGKRCDVEKLRESVQETSEEVGCFSF